MAEYIDRQEAINRLFEAIPYHVALQTGLERAINYLRAIPAADVRHAVYCKDCVHYEMGVCLKIYDDGAANKDAWQERKPDDFCSYGEKREES